MPNRTGVRSDIHGVGDSGDSGKGSGVLSWTFSIQCLFSGAFILRTPAQHMRYFMIAVSMLADFPLVWLGQHTVRECGCGAITWGVISVGLRLLDSRR